MAYVMLVVFLLALFLLGRYILLRRDIKQLKEQLQTINHHSQTNQLLTSPHQLQELSELIQEINKEILLKNQAIEHLEQRERQVKEQFTNISHDLRTPLASLLGYLTLLEEETTAEEQQRYRLLIHTKAKQLKKLIETYYDFAKVTSLDVPLVMTTIDLTQFLPQLLASYYDQFNQQQILPEISLPATSWLVLADEHALRRIFVNLIENSLKYGKQTLKISHKIDADSQKLIIQNRLLDTTSLEIEQVFTRLYTADKTRNSRSTGLGLTVVKQLLEQMGHQVEASLKNEWFTITITWQ